MTCSSFFLVKIPVVFGNADMPPYPLIMNSPVKSANPRGRLKSVRFSIEPMEFNHIKQRLQEVIRLWTWKQQLPCETEQIKWKLTLESVKRNRWTIQILLVQVVTNQPKKVKTTQKGKQRVVTSTQSNSITIKQSPQPMQALPSNMCSNFEHGDELTAVNRKNKKVKIDITPEGDIETTPASIVSSSFTNHAVHSVSSTSSWKSSSTISSNTDVNTAALLTTNDHRSRLTKVTPLLNKLVGSQRPNIPFHPLSLSSTVKSSKMWLSGTLWSIIRMPIVSK